MICIIYYIMLLNKSYHESEQVIAPDLPVRSIAANADPEAGFDSRTIVEFQKKYDEAKGPHLAAKIAYEASISHATDVQQRMNKAADADKVLLAKTLENARIQVLESFSRFYELDKNFKILSDSLSDLKDAEKLREEIARLRQNGEKLTLECKKHLQLLENCKENLVLAETELKFIQVNTQNLTRRFTALQDQVGQRLGKEVIDDLQLKIDKYKENLTEKRMVIKRMVKEKDDLFAKWKDLDELLQHNNIDLLFCINSRKYIIDKFNGIHNK